MIVLFSGWMELMVKRNMELELEAVRELQQEAIPIVAPVDEDEAEKLFQNGSERICRNICTRSKESFG
jgi:nitrogen regulatory protein PII-like uncharacterized protein